MRWPRGETGGDVILEWLERGTAVSILNVQELASKLAEAGVERGAVEATLVDLSLEVRGTTMRQRQRLDALA